MSKPNRSLAPERSVGSARLGPTLIEPTRRSVLAIGASAALAPLLRGTAVAQPAADLPALEGAVDRLVREIGIKPAEPGLAVTLLHPGRVLLQKAYGVADLRTGAPITPFTRFEIASVSKTFTATAVLMLQERGLLSIDDDVRKYLPELPQYAKRPVRLIDMLQHVSGLPIYFSLRDVPMRNKTYWVSEDYPAEFGRQRRQFPLRFPVGAKFEYNNTNFMLMAVVIARVAGKPFADFMHDEIFAPAGMTDSFVYGSPDSVPEGTDQRCDNAIGYELTQKRWVERWGTAPARHEQHLEVGDGAIWSNLADMANWDNALRTHLLLKPETMKLALTPSKTRGGETNGYGLGWALYIDVRGKLHAFGHRGRWNGFETNYHNDVSNNHTVVLLSNRGTNLDLELLRQRLDAAILTYARG
jgi:CubicO group peptidase (beta-lactamase class C family)